MSEAEAINRDLAVSLNRDVEIGNKSLPPDGGLEFSLGNRWFFGEEESWEFGALGLVSYDNTWRNRERTERDVADPINLVENRFRTINQVSATGVLNLGLNFTSDHQLTTSSFYLRNTEDESSISTRTNNNFQISNGQQLRDYDIRFEERELVANQIRGRHVIGADTQEIFQWLDRDFLDGVDVRVVLLRRHGRNGYTERDQILGGRPRRSNDRERAAEEHSPINVCGGLPLHVPSGRSR